MKSLFEEKNLEYYMLFSNRKLPGSIVNQITQKISEKTGLEQKKIALCGIEQIERWLKTYPLISQRIDINPLDAPLHFDPDDLAEVVDTLSKEIDSNTVKTAIDELPEIKRKSFEKKTKEDQLDKDYKNLLLKNYLRYRKEIEDFLAHPDNREIQEKYKETGEDFKNKITAFRRDYHDFAKVLEKIHELCCSRDSDLKRHKNLTRIVLHYMYFICDIGGRE